MHQRVSHIVSMRTLFTTFNVMEVELNRCQKHIGRDHSVRLNLAHSFRSNVGPCLIT